MRYNADCSMIGAANIKPGVFTFFAQCLLWLALLLFCPGCDRDTSPPDLSSCTRLKIRYPLSTANYFLPDTGLQESLLNPHEKEYIRSIEFFTVDDPERIKAFAHDVSLGTYSGSARFKKFDAGVPVLVDGYRDKEQVLSFTVYIDRIITEDDRIFDYPRGLPNLEIIEPLEMQPFKLRFQCGLNMQRIHTAGSLHHRDVSSYPGPTEWCDAVMRERMNKSYVSEEKVRAWFKCPAAGEGKCHYALNPHYEPNSPPDTVLLFETKAGWNQHGGPELFTFEHHEPRGGCVMLNDGTVKFIRTREELQQFRWK